MSGEQKAWSFAALCAATVLIVLILSIRSYNIRQLEYQQAREKAAMDASLCEAPNVGSSGTHYERCR